MSEGILAAALLSVSPHSSLLMSQLLIIVKERRPSLHRHRE
jgi:hypothetical protein